ncbi:solute carrier family 23 protein [Acinetobacter sp. ANC 4635]|uniref:solute carrier family 23 protein n=1 Tax=Acinetobacter sp. ANC 4635 TaxID=2529846 RepID=UPI001BC8886A|nr:solute carrier family 23 protein [Acinetobacter sp. ANC 4635]
MKTMFLDRKFYPSDLMSGLVVFLVALPLCLGIAHASGAPLLSGVIAGVIGGIVVGALSGSQISVSGPAAGLTAIILTQLMALDGQYSAFLLCVILAGLLQMVFGCLKLGSFANFVPTNVILGLLVAIGLILMINQLPNLFGLHMATVKQLGLQNFPQVLQHIDVGAAVIGVLSVALILLWDQTPLKKLQLPSALVAVVFAGVLNWLLIQTGSSFAVGDQHLIDLPSLFSSEEKIFYFPDFSYWNNPQIYVGAVTLAVVASLETLLNLEAADKMDPQKRSSPPNRELLAQGIGNTLSGFVGGMPVTSVIVRSSVNATSGSKTKVSTIFHGILLIIAIVFLTPLLNVVPLSALAAILLLTGYKLAQPKLFIQLYQKGWKQFLPFIVTIVAIMLTDLLIGIMIGLVLSALFILHSNMHSGVKVIHEKHLHGNLTRIELAQNVSFLNRATLLSVLNKIKRHETVVIDASNTVYIDPDLYQVIHEFQQDKATQQQIDLKLIGFQAHYPELHEDDVIDVDVSTRELQQQLTPELVLQKLKDGNQRFVSQQRLQHNIARQIQITAKYGQHPIAAVLGCMDSRAPTEMLFDVGVGDLFSLRIAGNIAGEKVLGSLEFACKSKGSRLIVVLGHTDCGAVTAACQMYQQQLDVSQAQDTPNIQYVLKPIMSAIDTVKNRMANDPNVHSFIDEVTMMNVKNNMAYILKHSNVLREMVEKGEVGIVGAIYDVKTGQVNFLE